MQFKPRFDQPYVILSLIFHVLVIVRSIYILNFSNFPIRWSNWDSGQRIFMITSILFTIYSVFHLWIQHSKIILYIINSLYIVSIVVSALNLGIDMFFDNSDHIFMHGGGGTGIFFLIFIVFHCVIYPLFRIIQFMRS